MPRQRGLLQRRLIRRRLRSRLLHLALGPRRRLFRLRLRALRLRNDFPRPVLHDLRLRHDLRDVLRALQFLRGLHRRVRRQHGRRRLFLRELRPVVRRFVRCRLGGLRGIFRGGQRLPRERSGEPRSFEGRELALRRVVLRGLLVHFFRHLRLGLRRGVELVLGVGQRVLRDCVQLLLHLRVFGQLPFQFLEQIRRAFLRHLRQLFGLVGLRVEILLAVPFLLPQLRAGPRDILPLGQRRVVPGDPVQRVHDLLLVPGRAFEIGFLPRGLGALRRSEQRLRRGGRRVFEREHRVIGIAHPLTLILWQNAPLIRIGADQILQRLDPQINPLLPRKLRLRLRLVLRRLGRASFRRVRDRHHFEHGFLLRQSEREFADRRREGVEIAPRERHRFAQKRERRPPAARRHVHLAAHARRRTIQLAAQAHLRGRRERRRTTGNRLDRRRRRVERRARFVILQPQSAKLPRHHLQARGQPCPIAHRHGPCLRSAQLPALQRAQRPEPLDDLLQTVTAFQNPQALPEHREALRGLLRAIAARQRLHILQRHGGPPQIADERVVRRRAAFLEITARLENLALRRPLRFELRRALFAGQLAQLRQRRALRGREFFHLCHRRLRGQQLLHARPRRVHLLDQAGVRPRHRLREIHRRNFADGQRAPAHFFERRRDDLPGELLLDGKGLGRLARRAFRESGKRVFELRSPRPGVEFAPHFFALAGKGELHPLGQGRRGAVVTFQRVQHVVHVLPHAQHRAQPRRHFRPLLRRLRARDQRRDARLLATHHEAQFRDDIDFLRRDVQPISIEREMRAHVHAARAFVRQPHEIARGGSGGLGGGEFEQHPHRARLAAVGQAEQAPEQHEVRGFVVRGRLAQRRVQRGPRGGELGLVVGKRGRPRRQHRRPHGVGSLGLVKLQARRFRRVCEHRPGAGERLHVFKKCLPTFQRAEPQHVEARRHDRDLQRTRLRAAALQVRGDQFCDEEIARLHALRREIPRPLHPRLAARRLGKSGLLPGASVHLHHLHEPGQPHVISRARGEFHEFVRARNQILLRLQQLDRGHEIRRGAQLVFWAEFVLEIRLCRDQMHAIRPRPGQRNPRAEPPVRQHGQRDFDLLLATIHAQLAALHRLIRRNLQLHLRALQPGQAPAVFLHRLHRDLRVRRGGVSLFKPDLVWPRHGGELEVFRAPGARLHPVAHVLAPDLDGRRELIFPHLRHLRHAPAIGGAHDLHLGGFWEQSADLDDHPHRVALRHRRVARLRPHDAQVRGRHIFQIRPRQQRAEEQRLKAILAHQQQRHHRHRDRRRHAERALDQRHRQQRSHLQILHPRRDIRLQQPAELPRIEHLALTPPQLHRRQQILAQLRLRMLHQPCDSPLIRRVQKLDQTQPPRDAQHRGIRHPAQRPPPPVRHQREKEIHPRDEDHRPDEHRHRRENPAHNDQQPPPARERLELSQNEGIEMGAHER